MVGLTVATDRSSYYIREPVVLGGSLTQGSQSATNYLIGVEVDNQQTGFPLFYRTVSVGNPAPYLGAWPVQITSVYVTDPSGNKTNSIPLGTRFMNLCATIHNNENTEVSVTVAGALFDGNLIPIAATQFSTSISPSADLTTSWGIPTVPTWAYSGEALATVSVYSNFPRDNGVPLAPEAQYVFYFTRNSGNPTPPSTLPVANSTSVGMYSIDFRMPPDEYTLPGNYSVFVTAVSPSDPALENDNSSSFTLANAPSPPQAAFTYTPLQVYDNMSVTFDASSSSAEGYNTTITQYAWTINDPNNQTNTVQTTPILSHTFVNAGTFVVTLNVTNSQGLWSTTSKPVVVNPDFGPTANFTWTPPKPTANQTVTFNASSSQLGYSGKIVGYANITSYTWNFGDGTSVNTTSNSVIGHSFKVSGNYTVYAVNLTITDSVSRTSTITQFVNVSSRFPEDLNGDGRVDMKDIAIVASAFGATPGSPTWNPIADVNGDGRVDMKDIALVAAYFGWPNLPS